VVCRRLTGYRLRLGSAPPLAPLAAAGRSAAA